MGKKRTYWDDDWTRRKAFFENYTSTQKDELFEKLAESNSMCGDKEENDKITKNEHWKNKFLI